MTTEALQDAIREAVVPVGRPDYGPAEWMGFKVGDTCTAVQDACLSWNEEVKRGQVFNIYAEQDLHCLTLLGEKDIYNYFIPGSYLPKHRRGAL